MNANQVSEPSMARSYVMVSLRLEQLIAEMQILESWVYIDGSENEKELIEGLYKELLNIEGDFHGGFLVKLIV